MKIANFIMKTLWTSCVSGMMVFAAINGAWWILDDLLWDTDIAVVFFIPFAVCVTWKIVKLEIIEIREYAETIKK